MHPPLLVSKADVVWHCRLSWLALIVPLVMYWTGQYLAFFDSVVRVLVVAVHSPRLDHSGLRDR